MGRRDADAGRAAADEAAAAKSFRNIDRIAVLEADSVGVADVVGAASVVVSEAALESISRRAEGAAGVRRQRRQVEEDG